MMNKKKISKVDPEYGVDSRYTTVRERKQDSVALMEARLSRMKNLSNEQLLRAKLLQLKLRMENYLNKPECNEPNQFAHFLVTYIDSLYPRRSAFASDINITPVYLSKVIHGHRLPNDAFLQKLMIHSERVYKNMGEFDNKTWYQIHFQEIICDTMSNQNQWRKAIEKQVQVRRALVK